MLDIIPYPREFIAERGVFTPADHAQIALCRGAHNRLGVAYQMAFLRLLEAPQRYTVLGCFLMQTYHETLDQLVEMYDKLITATYRRAQRHLADAAQDHMLLYN